MAIIIFSFKGKKMKNKVEIFDCLLFNGILI